ncbi:MAG TPA: uroporphyrinogen-III synthase [Candidatus Limnocylindria bacterium]|nr:uroporphyrinogen-III synthase [Candidatus Limnocylindria bacterium]
MFDLRGATVVVTRAAEDNAQLLPLLRDAADVIEFPCVRVEALEHVAELSAAVARLGKDDWVVVTSRHGADALARCGRVAARVAAIGAATGSRLEAAGIVVDFQPTAASGERLGRELPISTGRVLLMRSDRALPDLPRILRERGATVDEVVAYRTLAIPPRDDSDVREALASEAPVVLLFFSPSAVEGFVAALGIGALARAKVLCAGSTTQRAVLAYEPTADVSTIEMEVAHVAHR